jgi:phosphoribosylformylglycinamidine synthase I
LAKVAIIKYPGTNCEEETLYAVREVSKVYAEIVWHLEFRSKEWDAVIIPGGFSYGDYGRAGLIASWSRASSELIEASDNDIPILGICNGFQILVELELLPGSLLPNSNSKFIAKWVRVKVHNPRGPWLLLIENNSTLSMPIAHAEGRYYHNDINQILNISWLEYENNPNGSLNSIAGVANKEGNVLGLMPHPERASFPWQAPRGFDAGGRKIFESLGESLRRGW